MFKTRFMCNDETLKMSNTLSLILGIVAIIKSRSEKDGDLIPNVKEAANILFTSWLTDTLKIANIMAPMLGINQ